MRPDIILLDDIEDDEATTACIRRNSAWLRWVHLPMNDRAVVQWAGTTTMYGSATHDLVRTLYGERADWVDEYEFKPPTTRRSSRGMTGRRSRSGRSSGRWIGYRRSATRGYMHCNMTTVHVH